MPASHYTTPVRPTILVVDDYADSLDVWEIYLRAAGFEVTAVTTGDQALASVNAAAPDLVVMDLKLPGMSGNEVARVLRSQVETRHIPLIATTGVSLEAELEEARQSGFDLVMVKPCDPSVLVEEIRRLLTASAARRSAPAWHWELE